MANSIATKQKIYTQRLLRLNYVRWKTWFDVQGPYRRNLAMLQPGKTIDVGCGIGRHLKNLSNDSIGLDHNKYSIKQARQLGLLAFTPAGFKRSKWSKKTAFDSLLLSHVLEHLTYSEGLKLIQTYTPFLKYNGKLIIFCPQEKGYASDSTHVTFLTKSKLEAMVKQAGYDVVRSGSFPFPRPLGKIFKYNEFVIVGQKS